MARLFPRPIRAYRDSRRGIRAEVRLCKERVQPPILVVRGYWKQSGSTSEIRIAVPFFAGAHVCRGLLRHGSHSDRQRCYRDGRAAARNDDDAAFGDVVILSVAFEIESDFSAGGNMRVFVNDDST